MRRGSGRERGEEKREGDGPPPCVAMWPPMVNPSLPIPLIPIPSLHSGSILQTCLLASQPINWAGQSPGALKVLEVPSTQTYRYQYNQISK